MNKLKQLTSPEKRVLEAYIYFMRRAPDRVPSYRMIGDRARVSERIVPRCLWRLHDRGIIQFPQGGENSEIERIKVKEIVSYG